MQYNKYNLLNKSSDAEMCVFNDFEDQERSTLSLWPGIAQVLQIQQQNETKFPAHKPDVPVVTWFIECQPANGGWSRDFEHPWPVSPALKSKELLSKL